MIYKIKKKDLDMYIRNFRKLLNIGDGVIIAGDCMHPVPFEVGDDVLSVNGTTTVRSFFPFTLQRNVPMVTVMNLADILKELSELKGVSRLELRLDDNSIRIGFDDCEVVIATTNKSMNGQNYTDDYQSFQTLLKIVNCDDDGGTICTPFTEDQLNDARMSKPVTLTTDIGKVRVSRNLFSLSGPIKKTGPLPFSAMWTAHRVTIPDANEDGFVYDYVLALTVKYKDMEAVHLYSVTPF